MIPRFGLCMEGNEVYFAACLRDALLRFENATYIEVGVAAGQTFLSVLDEVQKRPLWWCVGIDIPDGWSLNLDFTQGRDDMEILGLDGPVDVESLDAYRHKVLLHPEGLRGLKDVVRVMDVGFALIDGCHGAPCVTQDFLTLEPLCVKGAIVAFHDVNPSCQGIHLQPHCKTGIDVRRALYDLGLLNNSRPGWRMIAEVPNVPHACAFFERV